MWYDVSVVGDTEVSSRECVVHRLLEIRVPKSRLPIRVELRTPLALDDDPLMDSIVGSNGSKCTSK